VCAKLVSSTGSRVYIRISGEPSHHNILLKPIRTGGLTLTNQPFFSLLGSFKLEYENIIEDYKSSVLLHQRISTEDPPPSRPPRPDYEAKLDD
jgi:hypothetical protein